MPKWLDVLQQTVTGGIGAGMGLALEGHNDRRQIRQQQKLQDMQIAGSKQLTDYNYGKQLQMWKDTNYQAQKEELKKAGLNPGLLYGMGGGGGTTAGSGSGGSVSTGQAPSGGGEIMGMMSKKMELQLLQAQKENIEADTANKQASAGNTNVVTDLNKLELDIKNNTRDVAIERIQAEAVKIDAEMEMAKNNRKVSDATLQTEIDKRKGELAQVFLRNDQIRSQTRLTDEQAKEVIQSIQTQIKQLQQGDEHIKIQQIRNELIKTGIWVGAGTQIVGDLISILKTPKRVGEIITETFDDGHGTKTTSTRRQ